TSKHADLNLVLFSGRLPHHPVPAKKAQRPHGLWRPPAVDRPGKQAGYGRAAAETEYIDAVVWPVNAHDIKIGALYDTAGASTSCQSQEMEDGSMLEFVAKPVA